ncbi:HNH endonuclease signature motif containing protein [Brevibacterium casei]|uniref:HNH endonuclease signature motif containing protein n=1 Tax=Brevibacterium casei TaxID=33889 RepID=UPI0036FBAC5A
MRDTTADLSGPDDPGTGTPDPVASSRYTLYLGSNLTDLATASTTVDLAQLHVFELTAGHILAEIIHDHDHPTPTDGTPYRFATIAETLNRHNGQPDSSHVANDAPTRPESADATSNTAPSAPADSGHVPVPADESGSPRLSAPADSTIEHPTIQDLPDFPGFTPDTTFSAWVHDHVATEHLGAISTILGTTTARTYRHLTQAVTLIHGLPRFTARARSGEFTLAHMITAADLCQTVAFEHLPRLDQHLATRRADVTSDTLRTGLRKLIHLLQTPDDRSHIAAQRRRVDVDTFGNGTACLSITAPADEIHAAYARVNAMARAIHNGQTTTLNLPAGVEIIDERTISALMCDMFLRPHPKLAIRVRELDPITGLQTHRETPLLDENGEPRFHYDDTTITGLTDLLTPAVREDTDAGPDGTEPRGTDPAATTIESPYPPGASFFPHGRPQPVVLEYAILVDMESGPEAMRNQAGVIVTVPFLTLTGDANLPGTLADGSPIPAETARRIAAGAPTLTRILTDPATGTPLDAQALTYAIPKPVRRTLINQWATCTFPGCTRTAEKTEIDHVDPFNHTDPIQGGLTQFGNLHPLCKKHHAVKTARRYAVDMNDRGSGTSRIAYEFPHGLMTTIEAPDQPIDIDHALAFADLARMRPCRWVTPDHDVPDEPAIIEVPPTREHVKEHRAQQRRIAEVAARDQALREATEASNAARARLRLDHAMDWEHAVFPACLPPGHDPVRMKALPPGTSDPYAATDAERGCTSARSSSLVWCTGRSLCETDPPLGHHPLGPVEPITGHRSLAQQRKHAIAQRAKRLRAATETKRQPARRRKTGGRKPKPRRTPTGYSTPTTTSPTPTTSPTRRTTTRQSSVASTPQVPPSIDPWTLAVDPDSDTRAPWESKVDASSTSGHPATANLDTTPPDPSATSTNTNPTTANPTTANAGPGFVTRGPVTEYDTSFTRQPPPVINWDHDPVTDPPPF